jgi:DNA-binding NarL/FixJ family response regulator
MGSNNLILSLDPLPRRTRVIVADPYPVIVHGVRKMVEDDLRLQVVAEASTLPSLRKRVISEEPEVALVDWFMASQDLADTTALLQSDLPTTSVIFLTVSENSQEKREMLRLGARGFLSKWTSARKLQTAVFEASKGRLALESSAAEAGLADNLSSPSATDSEPQRIERLTHRERQLLPLVCSSLKNKEIALWLGIAETTVWHHLTSIFAKLQVGDRLGLATFAYRHGLVLPDDGSVTIPSRSANLVGHTAQPCRADHAGVPTSESRNRANHRPSKTHLRRMADNVPRERSLNGSGPGAAAVMSSSANRSVGLRRDR